jgi:hypothetical protein
VLPAVVLAATLAASPGSSCQAPASALPEASGAVVSDRQPDVVFSHDDSGDSARFVALTEDCGVLATYRLPLPEPTDWEDAALGPHHTLVFADIGDNDSVRSSVQLVTVPEPLVGKPYDPKPIVRVLRYDDGAHDAEALLVQPRTGATWVVTKAYTGIAGVYAISGSQLHKVATVRLGPFEAVTGATVRGDGWALMLRTYDRAFEWEVPAGSTDLGAVLAGKSAHTLVLPTQPQGEGIAYNPDGASVVLTSEAQDAKTWPLDVVALPWRTPSPITSVIATRRRGRSWWVPLAISLSTAAVAVSLSLVSSRRARVRDEPER